MNEAEEMDGTSIISGSEASEMFEAIKAPLDTITVLVKSAIVRDEHLAVPF